MGTDAPQARAAAPGLCRSLPVMNTSSSWELLVVTGLILPLAVATAFFVAFYFVIKAAVSAALRDAGLRR